MTSTTIHIGATVPLTGPAAPGYDEIAPAMDAVFKWFNNHGGVYGRKIDYTYLDDAYNPANTATLTRKLVLQDNIFADVGSLGTPTQSRGAGILELGKGAAAVHRVGLRTVEQSEVPGELRLAAALYGRRKDPRRIHQGPLLRGQDRLPHPR